MELTSSLTLGLLSALLMTSFVKIFTVLNILRTGMGLTGAGFGSVILAAAIALSVLVMAPLAEKAGGLGPLLAPAAGQAGLEEKFRPFMERHLDPEMRVRIARLAQKLEQRQSGVPSAALASAATPGPSAPSRVPATPATSLSPQATTGSTATPNSPAPALSFSALVATFVLSELKAALQMGILLLVPFLVVDLLVANILMLLGITQIPALLVSLPCKLLLFLAVDGWGLIVEKCVGGYI
jgi:flagellar biosynthesis protein FliP